MSKFYSESTGGFYIKGVHPVIPSDAVEISDAKHAEMLRPVNKQQTLKQKREAAKDSVDSMAGQARSRFVSQGSLIQEEYRTAAAEVAEYRQTGEVPRSLQLLADLSRQSVDEAAIEIEHTAARYSQVLLAIREIRLTAKVAIDKAEADTINEILQNAETLFDEL